MRREIEPNCILVLFSVLIDKIGHPGVPALVRVDNFETDVVMREDDGGNMGVFIATVIQTDGGQNFAHLWSCVFHCLS